MLLGENTLLLLHRLKSIVLYSAHELSQMFSETQHVTQNKEMKFEVHSCRPLFTPHSALAGFREDATAALSLSRSTGPLSSAEIDDRGAA